MKTLYVLLIALSFAMVSCRAKQGDPGPAGANGANGADGVSTLTKQGSISGTLGYVDYKDSALSLPFSYEYSESLIESEYEVYTGDGTYYGINVTRRDPKDSEKKLIFYFEGDLNNDGSFGSPYYATVDFSYATLINKALFEFDDNDNDGDDAISFDTESSITNFALDTATGRLTVTYDIQYSASDILSDDQYDDSTPATLTGSVDVILNRRKAPVYVQLP
jgi:hypothetical protein